MNENESNESIRDSFLIQRCFRIEISKFNSIAIQYSIDTQDSIEIQYSLEFQLNVDNPIHKM